MTGWQQTLPALLERLDLEGAAVACLIEQCTTKARERADPALDPLAGDGTRPARQCTDARCFFRVAGAVDRVAGHRPEPLLSSAPPPG